MDRDPWAGLLNPGERILWQGQPEARIDWRGLKPVKLAVGAVFAAIGAGICGTGLVQIGGGDLMGAIPALFGLAFVAVGARAAVGDIVLDAYRRSNSWYTLTTERMLVATDAFGKKQLRDWPILPETGLIYEEGPPGSLLISGNRRAGFRHVAEARKVYDLARQVQRGQLRNDAGP